MNISIVGTGYVGLVTGVCLAKKGHEVICIDGRHDIVRKINNSVCPIYEPKLAELLIEVVKDKKLIATSDMEFAVNNTDITMVAVDAPAKDDKIDLSYMESCIKKIGSILEDKENYHVVCIRSTVPPCTTECIIKAAIEKYSQKAEGSFGLAMNPEFLREGSAVDDFMNPDRIIIGAFDDKSFDIMAEVYENYFDTPILKTNLSTAEMIKYTTSSLFAAMMSFANEISNICENLGEVDAIDVFNGLIMDRRIAIRNKTKFILPGLTQYLRPGCGFGGSCLPKDVRTLINHSKENGYKPEILQAVMNVNVAQPLKIVSKLVDILGDIRNKKIAVLGIASMADTDNIQESPAIEIVRELLKKGALVYVADPQAISNAKRELGEAEGLKFVKKHKDALRDAEGALLITPWEDYKKLKPKDFVKLMKRPVLIDGRRIYNDEDMESFEVVYTGIGLD